MRDGIYKDLPMPRGWRSLLRACEREVERDEIAPRLARKALVTDARRELSPSFLARFQAMALGTQQRLPGIDAPDGAFPVDSSASPLERLVCLSAERLGQEGLSGKVLQEQSIGSALGTWSTQRLRQAEQHILIKGGSGARPILNAVRAACNGVATDVAAELTEGAAKRTPSRARLRVDLDEDLSPRS